MNFNRLGSGCEGDIAPGYTRVRFLRRGAAGDFTTSLFMYSILPMNNREGPIPASTAIFFHRSYFRRVVLGELKHLHSLCRFIELSLGGSFSSSSSESSNILGLIAPPRLVRQVAGDLRALSSTTSVSTLTTLSVVKKRRRRRRKRRSVEKLATNIVQAQPDESGSGVDVSPTPVTDVACEAGKGLTWWSMYFNLLNFWVRFKEKIKNIPDNQKQVIAEEFTKSLIGARTFSVLEMVSRYDMNKGCSNIKLLIPFVFHNYTSRLRFLSRVLAHYILNRVFAYTSSLQGHLNVTQYNQYMRRQAANHTRHGGSSRRGPINNQPPLVIPPGQGGLAPPAAGGQAERSASARLSEELKVNELRAELAEQQDKLAERRNKFLAQNLLFRPGPLERCKVYRRDYRLPQILAGRDNPLLSPLCCPRDAVAISLGYVCYSYVDLCPRQSRQLISLVSSTDVEPGRLWQTVAYWARHFQIECEDMVLYVVQQHEINVAKLRLNLPPSKSLPAGDLNVPARFLPIGVPLDGMRGSRTTSLILSVINGSEVWIANPNSSLSSLLALSTRVLGSMQRSWFRLHHHTAQYLDLQPNTAYSLMLSMILTSSSLYLGTCMIRSGLKRYVQPRRLLARAAMLLIGAGVCALEQGMERFMNWKQMVLQSSSANLTRNVLSEWMENVICESKAGLSRSRTTSLIIAERLRQWFLR